MEKNIEKISSYKLSFYNIIFDFEEKKYLWNTLSGACICLDKEGFHYIREFNGEEDNTEYFNILYKNGCIIKSDFDELGKILSDERNVMENENPERLSFTIAPGLGCNYKCIYCFEEGNLNNKYMNDEIINKTIEYIYLRIKTNINLKSISVTWFGGEPLLYVKIIERISRALLKYCSDKGIKYRAGIITNGRFLTKENAMLLKELNVFQAQVSIDGPENIYCRLKKTTKEDFWKVIQNVNDASEYLRVNIRINTDEYTDSNNMFEVVETVMQSQVKNNIRFYPGFVRNYDRGNKLERIAHKIHIEHERQLYKYLEENYSTEAYSMPYPKRRRASCTQVCRANVCIGPEGEMYRCEHYFGDKSQVIGDIITGLYYNSVDNAYYIFKHRKSCKSCKYFPLCMGGCLDDRVNGHFSIACEKFKRGMLEMQQHKLKLINQSK